MPPTALTAVRLSMASRLRRHGGRRSEGILPPGLGEPPHNAQLGQQRTGRPIIIIARPVEAPFAERQRPGPMPSWRRRCAGAEGGRQIFSQADLDKPRQLELTMDVWATPAASQLEAGEALIPLLINLAALEIGSSFGELIGTRERATQNRPFAGHVDVLEQLKDRWAMTTSAPPEPQLVELGGSWVAPGRT